MMSCTEECQLDLDIGGQDTRITMQFRVDWARQWIPGQPKLQNKRPCQKYKPKHTTTQSSKICQYLNLKEAG